MARLVKRLRSSSTWVWLCLHLGELAIQIEQEFYGFSKRLSINSVVCVGGAGIDPQIRVLRRKPSFVIGTPGRLKDLMDRRELDLSKFNSVVLDEAEQLEPELLDASLVEDLLVEELHDRHVADPGHVDPLMRSH